MASTLLSIKEGDRGKSRKRIRATERERHWGPVISVRACLQ